ncbi:MAG: hypothetical protein PHS62_00900 [Patescibacteria group bacterium]|nr:hypothetical protein [Patescibacteria group bacterium]
MGYWDATDEFLREHSGHGPTCPNCGKAMFPEDDHGRFVCSCKLGGSFDVVSGEPTQASKIPQVDTDGMSDAEKAQIPLINRLESEPTAAEAKILLMLLRGPEVMDDPEYLKARQALKRERGE